MQALQQQLDNFKLFTTDVARIIFLMPQASHTSRNFEQVLRSSGQLVDFSYMALKVVRVIPLLLNLNQIDAINGTKIASLMHEVLIPQYCCDNSKDKSRHLIRTLPGYFSVAVVPVEADRLPVNTGRVSSRALKMLYRYLLYFYGNSEMKKTITRIVCAGIFLAAALALGQKMFMENQITASNQADARTDLTASEIGDGYSRNRLSAHNSVGITNIGDSIGSSAVESDTTAFTSTGEDSVHKNEDDVIGDDYTNNIYHAEDSEKTTGHSSRNNNNSNHASSGTSAGIGAGIGRRTADSPPGSGGSFFPGGGAAPHTGKDGKNTGSNDNANKEYSGNAAGTSTGANPNQDNTADKNNSDQGSAPNNNKSNPPPNIRDLNPEHKDKDNSEQGDMPSDNDRDDKPIGSSSPDAETPKYYNGPPGSEPYDPSQLHTPTAGNDYPSYPNTGTSGEAGGTAANAIPEPGSIFLIGLGSMILLWIRRRSTRN